MNNRVVLAGTALVVGLAMGMLLDFSYFQAAPTQFDTATPAASNVTIPISGSTKRQQERTRPPGVDRSDSVLVKDFTGVLASDPGFPQYYAVYQLASRADATDLPTLIKQALEIDDEFLRIGFATVFLERFTYLNPVAALSFVQTEIGETDAAFNNLAQVVYREWVRLDKNAAIAYLGNINNNQLKNLLTLSVARQRYLLTESDYQALVRQLPANSRGLLQRIAARNLDPEQTFANAWQETNLQNRYQMLTAAIRQWAAEDPLAAVDVIQGLQGDDRLPEMQRRQLLQLAVMQWGEKDFNAAFEFSQLVENNQELVQTLLFTLARTDPEKAVNLARQYENGNNQMPSLVSITYSAWANQDVKGLMNYLDANAIKPDQNTLQGIAYSYAQHYPAEALDWVKDQDPMLIASVAGVLSQNQPQLVETYFNGLESGPVKSQLVSVIANQKAAINPEAALQWLKQNADLTSTANYENAERAVMHQWIINDPQEFARNMDNYSVSENQNYIPVLFSAWFSKDQAGVRQWINSLPRGQIKDIALSQYTSRTADYRQDVSDLTYYLDQFSDSGIQQQAAESIIYRWMRQAPRKAEELMVRYDIDRAKIEERMSQMPGY